MEENKLPEIPSEFIEPYLAKFMGSMVEFVAGARTEEQQKELDFGWTVAEIKQWVKGVEVFVSMTCGLHAKTFMSNAYYNMWKNIPDDKLLEICKQVVREQFK